MKTILIATDFSEAATNAARYLAEFSQFIDLRRIILYHSFRIGHPEVILVTDVLVPPPSQIEELKAEAIQNLIALEAALKPILKKGIAIEYITDDRDLTTAINQITDQENVDLIVIGISGVGNKGKNIIGNSTFKIMQECTQSLLIIPANVVFKGIEKSMLASDFKDLAERLPVTPMKELLGKLQSKLCVVNIGQGERLEGESFKQQETTLRQLIDDLNPEYFYPDDHDKAEGLLSFAEKNQINLIIAIHRKRGLVEQFFHNSLTKKLAVKTTIPLLILHKK